MSEKTLEALPENGKHRRPWLILGGIALILVGVLGWLVLEDDSPPDDSEMIPKWTANNLHGNPLAVFCSESRQTKADAYGDLSPEVTQLKGGGIARAKAFLNEQTSALRAFDQITQTDPSTWLWPDGEHMALPYHSMEYLLNCAAIANVLGLKAKVLAHEGKIEEAVQLSLRLARLGSGMQRAEGTPMHLAVAMNIQRLGENGIVSAMNSKDAPRDVLVEALKELTNLEMPRRADLQFAMRADYRYFLNVLDIVEKSKSTSKTPADLARLPKFLFKRHRTMNLRLRVDIPIMNALNEGWREGLAAAQAGDQMLHDLGSKRSLGFFLDPNFGGKAFYIISAPTTLAFLRNSMDACAAREQRKVILALRLHEMDHGTLPAMLDALVPAYVPVVPEDIYTGKPLLWNRGERIVYSVGRNGTDDGGQINDERPGKGLDLGMSYPWKQVIKEL